MHHGLPYPELSAAGLRATPSDLARVILEVQRALRGEGALLSQASARDMLTPAKVGPVGLGFFVSGAGPDRRAVLPAYFERKTFLETDRSPGEPP